MARRDRPLAMAVVMKSSDSTPTMLARATRATTATKKIVMLKAGSTRCHSTSRTNAQPVALPRSDVMPCAGSQPRSTANRMMSSCPSQKIGTE